MKKTSALRIQNAVAGSGTRFLATAFREWQAGGMSHDEYLALIARWERARAAKRDGVHEHTLAANDAAREANKGLLDGAMVDTVGQTEDGGSRPIEDWLSQHERKQG